MNKAKYLPLVALPLLWASAALAQPAADAPKPGPDAKRGIEITAEQREAMHKDFCAERYGREVGRVAALETRLGLTDAQKKLWASWADGYKGRALKNQENCAARAPQLPGDKAQVDILEMEKAMEQHLADRLEQMKAGRPALEALYKSLTPAQKETFNRFFIQRAMHDMGPGKGHDGARHMGKGSPMMGDGQCAAGDDDSAAPRHHRSTR